MDHSTESQTDRKELKKTMSPAEVWALAVGAIIGWGCFVLPGTRFLPDAGPLGTCLAFLIGGGLLCTVALCYSILIKVYPVAGGSFTYAYVGFGTRAGFICGWALVLGYLCVIAANGTALALLSRFVLPGVFDVGYLYTVAGWDVYAGELAMMSAFFIFFGYMNFRGMDMASSLQLILAFALAGGVLLLMAVVVALSFGRDAHGWTWASGALLDDLMPWRWPRIMAALFAGVMLAVAGCIIQRLTGNPMASPEVLGISSGAAFGVVLMLFLVPGNAFGWLLPAGSLGAAVTLLIIMIAAGRGGFSPHRMLLAGMALSTAFTMLLMMLQASGDPRMAQVLTWISGSTYNATDAQVWRTGIVMVILLAITPLCRRWLTILPLGGDTARAVGMALTPTRIALLLLAACLTATATMTIGPLSFVGLMAPHIARMMGFRRTMPHIVISALVGGLLLVFADWCGRMVLFPFQIPAGLLSTFIGAPYFIYLLRKQSR